MKRKLLLLFVLLMTAATGAWADDVKYLYLTSTDGFATATLMYETPGSDPNPYYIYTGGRWDDSFDYDDQIKVTVITVHDSCTKFDGTSLQNLFHDFGQLTTINDIGNLNTSKVTNMNSMFHSCGALTTLDLRKWDTTEVTSMKEMFNFCTNLTAIYVGDKWSTAKVPYNEDMFKDCSKLPNYNSSFIDKTNANTGPDGYLNKVKVTANLANGAYWSTFYSNAYNHQAPEGTQMFAVKLEGTTITMTEIGDRIVKSDEGVVLKQVTESSEPTTTIIMTLTETTPTGDFTDNSLEGTMISIRNPGNAYVLNNGTAGIGFYKLSESGTIGANKAYLTYSGSNARGFFGLDDTTGIEMPVVEGNDNADTVVYDLQGRRVAQPTKGLYIVNGKKVVIK